MHCKLWTILLCFEIVILLISNTLMKNRLIIYAYSGILGWRVSPETSLISRWLPMGRVTTHYAVTLFTYDSDLLVECRKGLLQMAPNVGPLIQLAILDGGKRGSNGDLGTNSRPRWPLMCPWIPDGGTRDTRSGSGSNWETRSSGGRAREDAYAGHFWLLDTVGSRKVTVSDLCSFRVGKYCSLVQFLKGNFNSIKLVKSNFKIFVFSKLIKNNCKFFILIKLIRSNGTIFILIKLIGNNRKCFNYIMNNGYGVTNVKKN